MQRFMPLILRLVCDYFDVSTVRADIPESSPESAETPGTCETLSRNASRRRRPRDVQFGVTVLQDAGGCCSMLNPS